LAGSASLKDKSLTVTVTNPSLDQTLEAAIAIRGAKTQSAKSVTLAASDAHAHNSFAAPNTVNPKEESLSLRGPELTHRFPPASVTKLVLTVA
jgi:alpha-N-arabinofuranosidase